MAQAYVWIVILIALMLYDAFVVLSYLHIVIKAKLARLLECNAVFAVRALFIVSCISTSLYIYERLRVQLPGPPLVAYLGTYMSGVAATLSKANRHYMQVPGTSLFAYVGAIPIILLTTIWDQIKRSSKSLKARPIKQRCVCKKEFNDDLPFFGFIYYVAFWSGECD